MSPVRDRFHQFVADSAEDEARAIDLQVRRWLLEGRREVGVVIEDREESPRERAERETREKLFELNDTVASFYERQL